jgi:hypothetical protein
MNDLPYIYLDGNWFRKAQESLQSKSELLPVFLLLSCRKGAEVYPVAHPDVRLDGTFEGITKPGIEPGLLCLISLYIGRS